MAWKTKQYIQEHINAKILKLHKEKEVYWCIITHFQKYNYLHDVKDEKLKESAIYGYKSGNIK